MKEKFYPPSREEVIEPVWNNPDSALFLDWYLEQEARAEEDQAKEFTEFLRLVSENLAVLPTHLEEARAELKKNQERYELTPPKSEVLEMIETIKGRLSIKE